MSDSDRPRRWDGSVAGQYDDKWQRMEAAGHNPHGEVDFVQRYGPTSVLDAGCGTGRVAIELAHRGVDVVGSDVDEAMLGEARAKAPNLQWVASDLADLDLGREFDLVVMAGNVILFVEPGSEQRCVAGACRHVAAGGYLVAGFSLGRGVTANDWEAWMRNAGVEPFERFATWGGEPFAGGDYLVSVGQRQRLRSGG